MTEQTTGEDGPPAANAAPIPVPAPTMRSDWFPNNAVMLGVLLSIIGFILVVASLMVGNAGVGFDGHLRADAIARGDARLPAGAPSLATLDVGLRLKPGQVKEVGYVAALNWAIYSIVMSPLVLTSGLLAFRNIEPTLVKMAERGMIRKTETLEAMSAAEYLSHWRRADLVWRIMLILVCVCGIGFLAWDSWSSVNAPIVHPETLAGVTLADPVSEFDWSIACLLNGTKVNCAAQQTFDIIAYILVPGLSTLIAFSVAIVALRFMAFVANAGGPQNLWFVSVDASETDDDLLGWRVFEPFFSCLLYWALAVLFGLWLMVVQNTYLRDPTSSTIVEFLLNDSSVIVSLGNPDAIGKAVFNAGGFDKAVGAALTWLVADPSQKFFANPQEAIAIMLYAFVCAIAVVGAWWLLRVTALKSQLTTRQNLAYFAKAQGVKQRVLHERLQKMKAWPVAWIGQMRLFALMLLLFGSLVSYRLILIPLVLVISYILATVTKGLSKALAEPFKRKKAGAAPAPVFDDDDA